MHGIGAVDESYILICRLREISKRNGDRIKERARENRNFTCGL